MMICHVTAGMHLYGSLYDRVLNTRVFIGAILYLGIMELGFVDRP